MKISSNFLLIIILIIISNAVIAQVYPPQQQLVFDQMPNIPKPGYLNPITDPTFGSTVVRIGDQSVFNTHHNGLDTYHHYAKNQAWNSDGTLIKLQGWPSAILDGQTHQFIKTVWPPGGHHTWANTQPNLIYGTNHPNYDGNCISQLDVTTNTQSLIHCFGEYEFVSHGEYEGNMSNDDRYMALQCRKPNGAMEIACYDFVTDTKVSTLPAPVWPNNVTMSQSGNYVIVQWNVYGTGPAQGTWAYNRNNMSPIRNLSPLGGSHFDYGYDTQGNEVAVGPHVGNRSLRMIRIDNGAVNFLLGDNQMSWYIHVSCRNLDRPGWAYLTEFADPNTQTTKPNYQKIFAVELNPNANNNALTETFAHVHHSPNVNYERSPFGIPNRDGSRVMFRSDWMGNSSSEINSYVAYMPGGSTCNLSCTATQTSPSTCGNNNGQATATPANGTAPYNYLWNDPQSQTTSTANSLAPGTYTVNITDADNCSTSCNVTISGANSPTCSVTQTSAPTCGNSNGFATVTVQGGTAPYNYSWSNGRTTPTANGLSAGTYTVVITDANNCTTQCSVTLVDPSGLSCTIVETTPPTSGNNGVATVMPNGGTITTGDPRTDLLASPDRLGYGAAATGGTNYVYVTNFAQLKSALETAGNYVLLDPSIAGQGIGFTGRINFASNTTLDGSLAPGSWLYPNFNAGFPGSTNMFNFFSTNNNIVHSIELRGNRAMPYNGNHPSASVSAFNVRGSTIWFDHITITEFWAHSLMIAQGGNNVSISNLKTVNTGNGLWLYYNNDTPRHVSLFNSELNAQQNTPYNEGASHFHMWNNYIYDVLYGSSMAGFAENSAPGQNGPVRTFSENNVFSNNSPNAEYGLPLGANWGGPVQIPGYIYSTGAIYKNGGGASGNVINTTAPWTIPYSYTTMPSNQVEAYVAANAGKITGGGNVTYTYLWDDPAGQTTAIATGLAPGTYQVTVSDATGCTTVCSITLTSAPVVCAVKVWLEGTYDSTTGNLKNQLQQIGILPAGQPYSIMPWNYNGNEGAGWQQSDYPSGAIDWVLLSLRTTDLPSSEIGRGAGLLMEDGSIQNASIEVSGTPASAYYIVVEHRNHLPAMTPTPISLVNNTLTYDFRTSNSYNQGAGFGQTQLGNQWGMFAGNIDQSSAVGYEVSGADLILWNVANGNFNSYLLEDVNMDGDVNGQDRIMLNVNNGISSSVKK